MSKHLNNEASPADGSPLAFSGSIPQQYDDVLGPFLFEPYALDLAKRIDYGHAGNVLELACGTGRLTRHLLENLAPAAQLTATDINSDMLAVALAKLTAPQVNWARIDMTAIPYTDNQFDLVVCQFGLMFVLDKLSTFAEIRRVLKPGGKLMFNTWGKLAENTVWQIFNQFFTSQSTSNQVFTDQGPFSMRDEKAVLHGLEEAGFNACTVASVPKTGQIATAALAATGFVEGTPLSTAIRQTDPARLPVVLQALEHEFAGQLGTHPLQSPLHAWVFEATK